MDGGIRRGVHVLTALALGAQAVMIGRPYLWGLAVGGEQGVFLGVLAVVAVLMTFSLGRFLVLGRPPMVDSWYEQHKHWIYLILGGGLLYAAYVLM